MNGWLVVGIWLVIALCLYLFIRLVRKEAEKLNQEKHKSEPMFKMKVLK
jgi:hypothetical protein